MILQWSMILDSVLDECAQSLYHCPINESDTLSGKHCNIIEWMRYSQNRRVENISGLKKEIGRLSHMKDEADEQIIELTNHVTTLCKQQTILQEKFDHFHTIKETSAQQIEELQK